MKVAYPVLVNWFFHLYVKPPKPKHTPFNPEGHLLCLLFPQDRDEVTTVLVLINRKLYTPWFPYSQMQGKQSLLAGKHEGQIEQ